MNIYTKIFFYGGFAWALVSTALLFVAWWFIRHGQVVRHKTVMIILVVGGWLFVSSYVLRYRIPDFIHIEVPRNMIPWLAFHGTIGLIPLIGATFLIWSRLTGGDFETGLRAHLNRNHRKYGLTFLFLWVFTHFGGIANFFLLK